MEVEERSRRPSSIFERQSCGDDVEVQSGNEEGVTIVHSHLHCQQQQQRLSNHHNSSSFGRNIEIDWREVDPYFSELSDCASFWTLINFTCDVIYSGLFVLFFIMGQDVESMFFEGLLNHINPILIYLILSLVINYGALRSLRCGRETCFLVFSVMKGILFPITISLLVYLVFFDVQEYFGTFWVSFVVIVSCYNGTAALGLWSMFTCNKYILVNEAAQKRLRKQAKLQRLNLLTEETNCRCGLSAAPPSDSSMHYDNNQACATSAARPTSHIRKIGDSSCANNLILGCKPGSSGLCSVTSSKKICCNNKICGKDPCQPGSSGGPSRFTIAREKPCNDGDNEDEDDEVMSFEDQDEVLQISTVHKVMQEIKLLGPHPKRSASRNRDTSSDEGDSV